MLQLPFIAFLALFTSVFAMEKTLVLNKAGIAYDVRDLALDRARTDVRIVEDNMEFRCGDLRAEASAAPRYPTYRKCSLLSGNTEVDASFFFTLIRPLPAFNDTLILQDSLTVGFKYRRAIETANDTYNTRLGTVQIPEGDLVYAGRTIDRHGFVASKSLEKIVHFYPDDDDDVSREQSLSRDV